LKSAICAAIAIATLQLFSSELEAGFHPSVQPTGAATLFLYAMTANYQPLRIVNVKLQLWKQRNG